MMMNGKALLLGVALAGAAFVSGRSAASDYTPIEGGFEIVDGTADFTRPLYGCHVADNVRNPIKNLMWTGDRPRIQIGRYKPNTKFLIQEGVLEFGRGLAGVTFRYIEGRAEYDFRGRGSVTFVRCADSDGLMVEVKGTIPYEAEAPWTLLAEKRAGNAAYFHFGRPNERPVSDAAAAFAAGRERMRKLANTVRVRTPDKAFDSFISCMNVAADAAIESGIVMHGAQSWHVVYAGWRGAYAPVVLAWDDVVKTNAKAYFSAQKKDGRIPCRPWADAIYNMNEVFVDSLMLYWDRSADVAFFRNCAYDAVKRHLGWMEKEMKVPGTELYENLLDAWNTDNKWCNGGAGPIASAYTYRAYRTMAEIARKLGKNEDSARFAKRAAAIRADAERLLFDERAGTWGEYRERFGLGRLITSPDTSAIYTPIDMGLSDHRRSVSSLLWAERNIPSFFWNGAAILYSSNKPPRFWSTYGLYPAETADFAHAWFLAGEPEMGWRHLRDTITPSVSGPKSGPGSSFCEVTPTYLKHRDFTDTTAVMLRTAVEGVFGIHMDAGNGRVRIVPGFPAAWNSASIETPYLCYAWTRSGGVKVTKNPLGLKVTVETPKPELVGNRMPRPHTNCGHPRGEGTHYQIAPGAKPRPVSLGSVFNRNWRTLHKGPFNPRFRKWRTLNSRGRSNWEGRTDGGIPQKMTWPADGVVRSASGLEFRLGNAKGPNGAFVSFYNELPDALEVKLSGRASSVALLAALSTNPNISWMDAAVVTVRYADGGSETLRLTPPDNCDDWLNYKTDKPYHLTGEHIMFGAMAHANVLSVKTDPARELAAIELRCLGTETICGLLAVTLY